MRKLSSYALLKLADQFLILAESVDVHHDFLRTLKKFLNLYINKEDFGIWLENNKSILFDKLSNRWGEDYSYDDDGAIKNYLSYYKGNDNYYIITNNKELLNNFDIKESYFIKGYKNIPDLYMFLGKIEHNQSILLNLDKTVSHNGFIADVLQSLFPNNYKRIFLQNVTDFIKNNIKVINKIRSAIQFASPKIIGRGTDGVALSIADGMVLKIFVNKFSYDKAIESIENLHKNTINAKTEAMIYDAGLLGKFQDNDVYYYIIEKMIPVSKLDEKTYNYINEILSYIDDYFNKKWNYFLMLKKHFTANSKKTTNLIKNLIKDQINNILSEVKKYCQSAILYIGMKLKLKSTWLSSLIEEIIMKYLTSRGDLHTGNLGISNNGEFRYFDPAHPIWLNSLNF